jgi:mxaA protein
MRKFALPLAIMLAVVVAAALLMGVNDRAAPVRFESQDDHAATHTMGDLIVRDVVVASNGAQPDPASLPAPGALNEWAEIRKVETDSTGPSTPLTASEQTRVRVTYQVFYGVRGPETAELPPLRLRFEGAGGSQDVEAPALPVSFMPLIPPGIPDEKVTIRATRPAEPRPFSPYGQWLGFGLGLGGGAGVYLLWLRGLLPMLSGPLPFRRASRELEHLANQPAPGRAACLILHRALNETAGEAVFGNGLEAFLDRHPEFAGLRGTLDEFFALSRRLFFAEGSDGEAYSLCLKLARQARRLERRPS